MISGKGKLELGFEMGEDFAEQLFRQLTWLLFRRREEGRELDKFNNFLNIYKLHIYNLKNNDFHV
jgi:hypothetical protein